MGSHQINPQTPAPIVGQGTQTDLLNAIFGAAGFSTDPTTGQWRVAPSTPYPGALTMDPSQTRLPQVWGSWQPWDSGMGAIAQTLYGGGDQPGLGVGKASPYTSQMMQWGGTGGPGNLSMSNAMQWGTPSANLPYLSNLAQWGTTGPGGAGDPLKNLAMGYATGPASWLAPWLTTATGGGGRYNAPPVNIQPVTRKG